MTPSPFESHLPSPGRISPTLAIGLFLGALVLVSLAISMENPVEAWIQDFGTRTRAFWVVVSDAGKFEWIAAWLVPLAGWSIWKRRRALMVVSVAMIVSLVLSGVLSAAAKGAIGRTRPKIDATQGWYGPRHEGKWLVGNSDFNGFPSGHSTTAAGVAGVLVLSRSRSRWLGVVCAFAIAVSRVALTRHHLGDVVAGLLLGSAIAWWTWNRWVPRSAAILERLWRLGR